MIKKIIVPVIVVLVVLGCLLSGVVVINKNKNDKDNENNANLPTDIFTEQTDFLAKAKSEAEKNLEENFKDKDFEGVNFSVVIAEDNAMFMNIEGETSYSKALKLQSDLISEKLNCNIYINRMEYSAFLSDASAANNAGLFYADVVCVPQKSIGYMQSKGLISDLNQLYGDAFMEGYYFADSKKQSAGSNSFYCIASKSSMTPTSYGCVYFNKTITDYHGITEEIYDSFDEGNWTIDKMIEFKDMCADFRSDAFSIVGSASSTVIEALFSASGMKYFNTGIGVNPNLADNGKNLDRFVSKIQTMMNDGVISFGENAAELFEKEKALFYIGTLRDASKLKGMYGVMPLPKFEKTQKEYCGYNNGDALVYAVLTTNDRTEYVPDILKALSSTSALVHDGFARDLLDYALREPKSYFSVKKIMANPSFDFAYMFGESYPSIADSSYKALVNAVVNKTALGELRGKHEEQLAKDITAIFPKQEG